LMLGQRGMGSRIFSRFDPSRGNLEGYLLGVARKLTRKRRVRESRWISIDESLHFSRVPGEEIESQLDSGISLTRLRSSIRLLPIKYREALVLCCLQEQSYEQAAAILGCSVGTVASRLSRARKLLSARLTAKDRGAKPGIHPVGQAMRR